MGYTTDFTGYVSVEPPLSADEMAFLRKFAETRRMKSKKGPYYVDNPGFMGQDDSPDVIDYNSPPVGQPSLWCQWVPTDANSIAWDGGEKFYNSTEWMEYLIKHFIGKNPKAAKELPFLTGHTVNGTIDAQGEDPDDRWRLIVKDNKVSKQHGKFIWND